MQLKVQPLRTLLQVVFCDLCHLQRVCFDLKVYSNEAVVKHEHYLAHLF